jgi:two-component system, cell cycle sensor histidine kinase and response regulator CckA
MEANVQNGPLRAKKAPAAAAPAAPAPALRQLLEATPLPSWIYDRDTLAFLEVNDAAVATYGYSRAELLGMTILDIRPREDVPGLLHRLDELRGGASSDGTLWRHCTRDGRRLSVLLRGRDVELGGVRGRLIVAHDLTAQLEAERVARQLELQLQQAEKLGAIGRLAAGMAHDFNNILTAVLGFSGLLAAAMDPADPLREDVAEIERAGQRGAELTQQILALSRHYASAAGEPTQPAAREVQLAVVDPGRRHIRDTTPAPSP